MMLTNISQYEYSIVELPPLRELILDLSYSAQAKPSCKKTTKFTPTTDSRRVDANNTHLSCSMCGDVKPVSSFNLQTRKLISSMVTYYQSYCKSCAVLYSKGVR